MRIRLLLIALLTGSMVLAAPPAEEGKSIFTARCASCHNVTKQVLGPALAGVDKRRSMDWIVAFVQSSQAVIKKGDKDAVALFEKFNKVPMPDHSDLSPEQIKNIVEYIKTEEKLAIAARPEVESRKEIPARPLGTNDYLMYSVLGVSLLLLLLSLYAWVRVLKMRAQKLPTES